MNLRPTKWGQWPVGVAASPSHRSPDRVISVDLVASYASLHVRSAPIAKDRRQDVA
jgi:hypothetical protein